jgi:hypothetical protein
MRTPDTAYVPAKERRRAMTCGNTVGAAAHIKENVEGFVRRIDFEPGYDCWTSGECKPRHGRHGMNIRFLLIGEAGAVQFLVYALDWLPGSIDHGSTKRDMQMSGLMAADLGYHWTSPQYGSQDASDEGCEYLEGATCFYDGSGLNAEPVLVRFLEDGLDAVWEDLQAYYLDLCARPNDDGAV